MAKFCHLLGRVHLVGMHLTSCSYSHSHNHTLHCLPTWLMQEQRLAQVKNNQSIMRYIADTPYRSICVRSVIALTQPSVTLQTHHTEVSVSEVSSHLHSHALHCRHTIQKYLCQKCQRTYTSLDVATFPMVDHAFQCEHCSEEGFDVPLRESYQGQDGDLVDAQQRAQRVSQAKQMQVMQIFPSS